MSMLTAQRRRCRALAAEARRDRAAVDAARLVLMLRLRRTLTSPAGLLGFFAAGLASRVLLSALASSGGERGDGARRSVFSQGRRAVATGLWLLRMIDALGGPGPG